MPKESPVHTVAVYEAEEGGYWAEVLDLPGCVAQAETLDGLRKALAEAIEAFQATRHELGQEPEPNPAFTWSFRTGDADLVRAG